MRKTHYLMEKCSAQAPASTCENWGWEKARLGFFRITPTRLQQLMVCTRFGPRDGLGWARL